MSYDLTRVQNEFIAVCAKAGVAVTTPIKLNGRLKSTLGRVTERISFEDFNYHPTLVEFSKDLIENATDKSIHDVIYHEAAHYIITERTGEHHGHDALFKAVCAEIGTNNDHTKYKTEWKNDVDKFAHYNYLVYCDNCNTLIGTYVRDCATLRRIRSNTGECSCAHCRSKNLRIVDNRKKEVEHGKH